MKLTNDLGLPAPLVAAIANDSYDKGKADFTTTQLIAPARIEELKRRHADVLTEDASDRIWSLIGQIGHGMMERAGAADSLRYVVERRFYIQREGVTIGGQIDLYDRETGELSDWKVTSLWTGKNGAKPEWIAQANINALLLAENALPVKKLAYYGIFRDWSKLKAEREPRVYTVQGGWKSDYPQRQVAKFVLPIWPAAKTEAYISERIQAHRSARVTLPLCSDEERWMRPEKYALMKRGQKRAVKLYDTEDQAKIGEAHLISQGASSKIEYRPGENVRCEHYCQVSQYCTQFRELMQG